MYSEHYQASKMEHFTKIVQFLVGNYFRKKPHLTCLTVFSIRFCVTDTAWKVSRYGVISGPNTGKYGPEITPYLDTFHAVRTKTNNATTQKLKFSIKGAMPRCRSFASRTVFLYYSLGQSLTLRVFRSSNIVD